MREYEKAFLARFFIIFFALFAILLFAPPVPLNSAIAGIEASLMHSSGVPVAVDGTVLSLGASSAEIVNECSGLVMVILLASLLYSSDIPENRRRLALLAFTPFLLLFNIARLYATLYAYFAAHQLFEAVHVILWFVDSAVVLACWYYAFRGRAGFFNDLRGVLRRRHSCSQGRRS